MPTSFKILANIPTQWKKKKYPSKPIWFTIIVAVTLLHIQCNRPTIESIKKQTPQAQFQAGLKAFQEEDYWRALDIFQLIVSGAPDHPLHEQALFYTALCHFHLKSYYSALDYFFRFLHTYPTSALREQARYYIARAYYAITLPPELDQTLTYRAMEVIRLFLREYPQSQYAPECQQMLRDLEARIATKAYLNAMVYYKIGKYRAAVIAIENTLKEYPLHPRRAELAYYLVRAAAEYARQSIPEKQPERWQKVRKLAHQYRYAYEGTPWEKKVLAIMEGIPSVADRPASERAQASSTSEMPQTRKNKPGKPARP